MLCRYCHSSIVYDPIYISPITGKPLKNPYCKYCYESIIHLRVAEDIEYKQIMIEWAETGFQNLDKDKGWQNEA